MIELKKYIDQTIQHVYVKEMADQAASLTHKAYKFGSSLINVNAASRVEEANLDY